MDTRWPRKPTSTEPTPIPARATLMGKPMASTDPNASTRMMMAKPTPMASDEGASKSAKMPPPSSISTPSRSFGSWRLMSLREARSPPPP